METVWQDGDAPWPDWSDLGRQVEFEFLDGSTLSGELTYEDMTPGPNEWPVLLIAERGVQHSFLNFVFDLKARWRYLN